MGLDKQYRDLYGYRLWIEIDYCSLKIQLGGNSWFFHMPRSFSYSFSASMYAASFQLPTRSRGNSLGRQMIRRWIVLINVFGFLKEFFMLLVNQVIQEFYNYEELINASDSEELAKLVVPSTVGRSVNSVKMAKLSVDCMRGLGQKSNQSRQSRMNFVMLISGCIYAPIT